MDAKRIEAIYPVSPFQEALLAQIVEAQTVYQAHSLLICALHGRLDIATFEESWNLVVNRQPILRTSFVWKTVAKPVQVAHRKLKPSIERQDWRGMSISQQENSLMECLDSEMRRRVNPSEAGAVRLYLCQTADDAYRLVCSYSRLLLDERSVGLLLRELLVCYEGLRGGQDPQPEQVSSYRDYITWLGQQDPSEAVTFWRAALEGFSSATTLAGVQNLGNIARAKEESGQRQMRLSSSVVARLRPMMAERQFTLSSLLEGAWALLLSRYSGERKVIFGVTLTARSVDSEAAETMLGPLTNTLPALVDVCDEGVASSWLKELEMRQTGLRRHAHNSTAQIRDWIGQPGDMTLFESRLILDPNSTDVFSPHMFGALSITDTRSLSQDELSLSIEWLPVPDPIVQLTYHRPGFDDATIERMLHHVGTILEAISANPQAKIGELSLLSQAERQEVLLKWNQTAAEYPRDRSIRELFEEQVKQNPEKVAVVYEGQALSYRELNRRANQLAHHLHGLGVGPEAPVGICMERSLEMIVGLLGILKAGGAYLPLDPEYPMERLGYMLEDAGAGVALTQGQSGGRLRAFWGQTVRLDEEWERISEESESDPESGVEPENPAYVIYTSGSTGYPKGVSVTQRNVARLVKNNRYAALDERQTLLQNAPLAFDASTFEIWGALLNGGRLVVMGAQEMDLRQLGEVIWRQQVTTLWMTASLFNAMVDFAGGVEQLRGVEQLLVGGEALSPSHLRRAAERLAATELINGYGPTEGTTFSCCHRIRGEDLADGRSIPIGQAIANTEVYILDKGLGLAPVGVRGELYIGGEGVARSYLARPDLTAERFVPNQYSREGGERLYRTGDLVRYLTNGEIEFIGRVDDQVKVRGYRIELGEIQAMLGEHRSVRQSVVIASEDERGGKRLLGYVVAEDGVTAAALKRYLKERLPDYMVPGTIMILETMPLTSNGKIDRKRLPSVNDAGRTIEQEYVGARTPVEEVLVGIFQEVLKLGRVGIRDNFFELGGDSILSLQIISRANEAGLGLTPKQLFQHQSIAELAAVARADEMTESEQPGGVGEVPLTPIQQWFFEGDDEEPDHFNQAMMLEAKEELDLEAFSEVIKQLIKQHGALSHRFHKTTSGWRQVCEEPDGAVALEKIDLSGIDEGSESRAIEEAAADYQKRMNLGEGPLMRVVVFEGKGSRQRVMFIVHHLVIDGVSWRILFGDIERGYEQARRGEEIKLGVKTTSYKHWAERLKEEAQRESAKEKASYWLAGDGESVKRLPRDKEAANTAASSKSVIASLNQEETMALLQEVPRAYKTQIQEVLLVAVARSLSEWSKDRTVLLDVEGHGREEIVEGVDLTRTVGWFTTIYPLKVEVRDSNNLELLRNAKDPIREAGRRGIYFGMLKYLSEDSDLREKLRVSCEAEISFNYLGQLDLVLKEGSLFRGAKESPGETESRKGKRRYLIEIIGSVRSGKLHLVWTYSENVHRRETIEAIAGRTMEALREVVAGSRSAAGRPYTPSDFPLARLDQRWLDQLMSENKEIEDIYALSPLQKAMLFQELSGSNSQSLFIQVTCNIRGKVNLTAFKKAWQHVVERHPILRASFEWDELDDPVQIAHRRVETPIDYLDWGAITTQEQKSRFEVLIQADRWRGIDLSHPPLMRLSLIRLGDELYRLIWSHHHILSDGWSVPLILQEFFVGYEAYRMGEEPVMEERTSYREYIAWLKRQDMQAAEAYWQGRLRDFTQPTKLWIDRGRGRLTQGEETYQDRQAKLDKEATEKLQAFARRHRLTTNTILQAAWSLLLGKYSGEKDIVFGTTVSGRPVDLPGSNTIIGPFINTLPVRVKIPYQSSLLPWLSDIQSNHIEDGQYAYTSLVEQYSEIPLGIPLYESILIFENYPTAQPTSSSTSSSTSTSQHKARRLEIGDLWAPVRTKHPLTLVSGPGSELTLNIAYDLRRFDALDIDRLLLHCRNIIEEIAKDPEQPIWSLSPLSRSEQDQMLAGWKGRERTDAEDSYIHRMMESQAEKAPDAIAIVFGQEQISYLELNLRANQLAAYLQARGIGPEAGVGIYLEPSVSLLVGALGIMKTGGICVALTPADLADHVVSILLTQQSLIESGLEVKAEIVRLDSDWEMIAGRSGTNPGASVKGDNLAFILYTSGATGEPKRVMITHRGMRNHLLGRREAVSLSEEDSVLADHRLYTGVSMLELLWPLLAGARLVMVRPEAYQHRDWLPALIAAQKITTTCLTPSLFSLLLREEAFKNCDSLRRIILSGETLYRRIRERAFAGMDVELYNLYSVTEASGAITTQDCRSQLDGEITPIGHPLANNRIYLLDSHLQPAPAGGAGEVWISGEGLARGYCDRPGLTAERFIPNPFSEDPGARMFSSKDVARCMLDGKIEVLTRSEHQIKLRFGRIEPAMIESALMEYPGVDQAALLPTGDVVGGARLTVYLASNTSSEPSAEELRQFLRERFPAQMIPSAFLMMNSLPLTISGRLDRKALEAMKRNTADSGITSASNGAPYEEMLSAICADLLGVGAVSREDNFFRMGGHSLLATQLISRVREVFKVEVPLRTVFEEPTTEGLARRIEEAMRAGEKQTPPPLIRVSRERQGGEKLPLSFAQQRLWFLAQIAPNNPFYNYPGAVRLESKSDLETLERVINEIVRRHEVLRTRFEVEQGKPFQVIDEWEPRKLEVEDLTSLPWEEREKEISRRVREEAMTGFDLSKGPLLRVKILKIEEDEHIALYTMHHIICDGWSMEILNREIGTLYQAFSAGEPSPLAELPIQYADFAVWQRQWLQGEVLEEKLEYWRKNLAGVENLELPIDHPRPAVASYRGAKHPFKRERELAEKLRELSRREGVTLFMTLLAGFDVLMNRYSGQQDIALGTEIANRNRAETEGLIGFFVNQLVMRAQVKAGESFRELLKRVREVCLGAYAHQDVPFEKLVEELLPERDLSLSPLFQANLILQNTPKETLELGGVLRNRGGRQIKTVSEMETTTFDLTVAIADVGSDLVGLVEYSRSIFEVATIERLMSHYTNVLREIVEKSEKPISELSLLSEEEREQIVVEWNATGRPYPQNQRIHQLFAEQAESNPERIALICEGKQVSYRELNRRANRLARYLQRLGVGPETVVGLCLDRSMEMVTAVMGVLKAGGAYLPLDPESPLERLALMLEGAGAGVTLTRQEFESRLPVFRGRIVCLDKEWEKIGEESESDPESVVAAGNLAYVIYTSGSTGEPKGVAVHHRALVARTVALIEAYDLTSADRHLQFVSPFFDAFAEEVFPTLICGSSLVVDRSVVNYSARDFFDMVERLSITTLHLPPVYWRQLVDELSTNRRPVSTQLKLYITGGESPPVEALKRWAELTPPQTAFINAYGPAEATITSTVYRIQSGSDPISLQTRVPIGRPIANTRVYILDHNREVAPLGVKGEIYIGGVGVARGYWRRADLTAERFAPNPFGGHGERLYQTGDLGRYRAEGDIEYLDRIDHQVKIRSIRIELGEIEAALNRHELVRQSVVVASEGYNGAKRLCGYVVGEDGIEAAELKRYLKERLPQYLIPEAISVLEALPLTATGKIDRNRLPRLDQVPQASDITYIAPRTELERVIAAVWEELLQVRQVGVYDNFFELGAHSLLMVQAASKLEAIIQREVPVLKLFEYPTISALAAYLSPERADKDEPQARGNGALNEDLGDRVPAKASDEYSRDGAHIDDPARRNGRSRAAFDRSSEIAIIGMSGRFPQAPTIEVFWRNLCNASEAITPLSDSQILAAGVDPGALADPRYVKAAALLDGVDLFDASFFGLTPRDAEILDPQHRLFLQSAWHALESSGYVPDRFPGRIGLFAGSGFQSYLVSILSSNPEVVARVGQFQTFISNDKDFLPTRISYKLNLRGPSVAVQTACSTSLVAVHLACQSLLNGECDVALAGGVSVSARQDIGYFYQEGGVHSSDGHCRAFDAQASGTVGGNGLGVVVLKSLAEARADGDNILAVIKGSAINNDGSNKVGYTAPSIDGQAQVITEAQVIAGVDPATITYVEAHGTGTALGDPIEIAALTQAFRARTDKRGFCAIGSVKTNVGHLDTAAGVTGLIKTVLAMKYRQIPPSLHFETPNPQIDFANSPFYVNTVLRPWEPCDAPRRAGVSSFGIGGTNAHLILEEAPEAAPTEVIEGWQLLTLSARSDRALTAMAAQLAAHLRQHPELNLADVAYTLQEGRKAFTHRLVLICRDLSEAIEALEENAGGQRSYRAVAGEQATPVVYLFPSNGVQYVGMGRELYEREPVFRSVIDHCAETVEEELGLDLKQALYADPEGSADAEARAFGLINQTHVAHAALFAVELGLARMWRSKGVQPAAMIGHSMGEYVAACVAGVMSEEDAIKLISKRGMLMQCTRPGAMMAVALSKSELEKELLKAGGRLDVAAINGPRQCVVSGEEEAVAEFERRLTTAGADYTRLKIALAGHSRLMEEIVGEYESEVGKVELKRPVIPYISNVSGQWVNSEDAQEAGYWSRQMREPVKFWEGLEQIGSDIKERVLLELGPGTTLSKLGRQLSGKGRQGEVVTLGSEEQGAAKAVMEAVGKLWAHGAEISWEKWRKGKRRRVELPGYPFEENRYWLEGPRTRAGVGAVRRKEEVGEWFYMPAWKQTAVILKREEEREPWRWLIMEDEEGIGERIAAELQRRGDVVTRVRKAKRYEQKGEREFGIRVGEAGDYLAVLKQLKDRGESPEKIVHLFSLSRGEGKNTQGWEKRIEAAAEAGFYSLVYVAQAIGQMTGGAEVEVVGVSNGAAEVGGEEEVRAEKSLALGPIKVMRQENPQVKSRFIDVVIPPPGSWQESRLIEQLIGDLSNKSADQMVAYRGNHRWAQRYEKMRIAPAPVAAGLRSEGVYLITGGLGGIGLVLAEYLAHSVRARLVLTGREGLPERSEWDRLLGEADAETNKKIRWKISKIKELEAAGAEVEVIRADVSEEKEMREVARRTRRRFGPIHGVIHAAGIVTEEYIRSLQEITPANTDKFFRPKVHGLFVLERVFRGADLDFCLLFSSLSSILGGLGFAAYSGSNIFMDTFVYARNRISPVPWISVNWDSWQVNRRDNQERTGFGAETANLIIKPHEGMDAFQRIISSKMTNQVIISTGDLESRMRKWVDLESLETRQQQDQPELATSYSRPESAATYVAPRNDLERSIAAIWRDLLGIEQIGIHDNFFELGGQSLLVIQCLSRLRQTFQVEIAIRSLFEKPTILGQGEIIEEALIKEIEVLTEEEVASMRKEGKDHD